MSTKEMQVYELDMVEAAAQPVESSRRSVGSAVLHFAERALSFVPVAAPEHMSQHFGHAERRNDPSPDVVYYKT